MQQNDLCRSRQVGTLIGRTALTVFAKGKEGQPSTQPTEDTAQGRIVPSQHPLVKATTQNKTWPVETKQNITMIPRYRQMVIARLELEGKEEPHC